MISPHERQDQITQKIIQILCQYLAPKQIILFGSRGKGNAHTGSDFDFAVDSKRPSIEKETKISEAIEHISGLHDVDLIYLSEVNKDFREIILKTGKVIYERRS